MEILEKILGSGARVKIMKLFLINRGKGFKTKDIAKRSRVSPEVVRREVKLLASVNFIRKRSSLSPEWYFNSFFKYAPEFEELLVRSDTLNKQTISDNLKNIGRVKLLIISGVFIKSDNSRVDLLIVGDKLKKGEICIISSFETFWLSKMGLFCRQKALGSYPQRDFRKP